MKDKSTIRDAQALAEFANLRHDGICRFRRIESDFAPQGWWEYQPADKVEKPISWARQYSADGTKQWQQNQACLRAAWRAQFHIELPQLIELLLSVFDPGNVFETWFDLTSNLPAFATQFLTDRLYPYHRAVLFLYEQKWRARLCELCKSRFVAGHSKQRYCGQEWGEERETCFDLVRREQKRQDHWKHRKARNRKRRREYAENMRKRRA